MRILFLTHRVPFPPDKGDRIRSYNILKCLARNHSISLVSASHETVVPASVEALRPYCASVDVVKIDPTLSKVRSGLHLLTRQPLTLPAFYSRRLERKINQKLHVEKYDRVYIYSSAMSQYVLNAPVPKLMDFIDMDSQKWLDYAERAGVPMRWVYRREGKTLRAFEKMVAGVCNLNIVSSERELDLLQEIAPGAPAMAVPNGVDCSCKERNPAALNHLVFVGSMDYLPNVDAMIYFVEEILPLVQKEVPDVQLTIVGRKPPKRIKSYERLGNVTVTGYVKDVEPYLQTAAAAVIPLRIARGIQTKLLEAMAHGLPVIGTSAALAGITAVPGRDLLAGDSAESFAQNTIVVLKDPDLRRKLGEHALDLVRKDYNWQNRLQQLEDALTSMPEA